MKITFEIQERKTGNKRWITMHKCRTLKAAYRWWDKQPTNQEIYHNNKEFRIIRNELDQVFEEFFISKKSLYDAICKMKVNL